MVFKHGSFVHFYQSLLKNTTYNDGFIVHQFKRVANPERPTEKEINKARQLIRLSGTNINYSIKIKEPNTALDSALVILKKVKLPKFKDYLYKSKVSINDIISNKNGVYYLEFKNNLTVIYTKELEEKGFILRKSFSKMRKAYQQTSSVIAVNIPTILSDKGILANPLDVFYEGYWSYEKFANLLPLDYLPTIK